jgi:hypothetical protein
MIEEADLIVHLTKALTAQQTLIQRETLKITSITNKSKIKSDMESESVSSIEYAKAHYLSLRLAVSFNQHSILRSLCSNELYLDHWEEFMVIDGNNLDRMLKVLKPIVLVSEKMKEGESGSLFLSEVSILLLILLYCLDISIDLVTYA